MATLRILKRVVSVAAFILAALATAVFYAAGLTSNPLAYAIVALLLCLGFMPFFSPQKHSGWLKTAGLVFGAVVFYAMAYHAYLDADAPRSCDSGGRVLGCLLRKAGHGVFGPLSDVVMLCLIGGAFLIGAYLQFSNLRES